MRTGTAQTFTIISLLTFLIAVPVSSFAADQDTAFDRQSNVDHFTLAQYYKNQADELKVKIDEQIDALSHKPRSSFLGRNGQNIKKHVEFKIHQYEIAIADNLKKVEYHQKMAAEQHPVRPASVASDKAKS
ncbi:MAG: hypothetical protein KF908_00735 [Nitrosomonas sp.]|nr:hypothetical protein [Nitrosomonas sp.]MCW5606561.1 hypothetical protein [Nitrosomonas sp.]